MKKISINVTIKMLILTIMALATMPRSAFCQAKAPDADISTYTRSAGAGQQVTFRLPKDIRSGDMITGTVVEKSNGKPTLNRSSSTIEGVVIEIDGKQTKRRNNTFSFIVPAGVTALPFILRNAAGQVVDQGQIPMTLSNISYLGQNGSSLVSSLPSAQTFFPAVITQPGEALTIPGFFDGNATNTDVLLNGHQCDIIAESPRQVYVEIPKETPSGNTNITISENGHKEEHKINVIGLNLTAPKTNLTRGEKTTIRVEVTGLEGIAPGHTIKVSVENQSPQTITFLKESGNTITKEISAGSASNGSYEFNTRIIAQTAGSFTISANLTAPANDNDCVKKYQDCMAQIKADKEKAIRNCNNGNPTAAAKCIAEVTAASDKLEKACFDDFMKCRK